MFPLRFPSQEERIRFFMLLVYLPDLCLFLYPFLKLCVFWVIAIMFQNPDDSALAITNIIRQQESEYLAALEVMVIWLYMYQLADSLI